MSVLLRMVLTVKLLGWVSNGVQIVVKKPHTHIINLIKIGPTPTSKHCLQLTWPGDTMSKGYINDFVHTAYNTLHTHI